MLRRAEPPAGAGLLKEIRAKAGAPIWRRDDESGQTYALKLTAAGAKAIAVDEAPASESMGEQRANHPISVNPKPEPVSDPAGIDRPNSNVASTPTSPRGGTKIAQVIELLQRGDGATLAELVAATGWLPHTTRAALTGLRKRGYAVGGKASSAGEVLERGSGLNARPVGRQARQPDGGKRSGGNIRAGGLFRLILIHHNRAPCAERTGFPFGVEHCVLVRRGAHDARMTQPPLRLQPIRGSSQ